MNISRGWLLVVVAAATVASGDNGKRPSPDAAPDTDNGRAQIARGEYIMNVTAACGFCHTPLLPNGTRDLDKAFSGIDCLVDLDSPTFLDDGGPTGCLSARNLTPDPTGIGNATDAQIKNSFLNGVRTDGKKIVPLMPWYIFHNMTDDDADAIVAYLRSLPPVSHTVKPNQPPFSLFNDGIPVPQVPFLATWEALTPLLDSQIPYPRGGTNNQSAMRGRYLTSTVGLCIDCHTPEISPFFLQLDMDPSDGFGGAFTGGKGFPKQQLGLIDASYPPFIFTRNLTSDTTGLGMFTKAQIIAAIKDGRDPDGKEVCAATHGKLTAPYAALTEDDVNDIAEYLINLPAQVANCGTPPMPLDDPAPEDTADCGNLADDDGDTVADDGCPLPCPDCQGPAVP